MRAQIAYLNWLALGRPAAPVHHPPFSSQPTPAQCELIQSLMGAARDFARRQVNSWRGGRATLRDRLWHSSPGYEKPNETEGPLWITSDNASLPKEAATVPLGSPLVHPVLRNIYSTLDIFNKPAAEVPAVAPNTCRRVTSRECVSCSP